MARRIFRFPYFFCRSILLKSNVTCIKKPLLRSCFKRPNVGIHILRKYSQVVDHGVFEESSLEFDDDWDADGSIRTAVAYDPTDPIIKDLLNSTTVQNILDIIEAQQHDLKKEYQIQSILMIWYLQKVFVKVQAQMGVISDVTEADFVSKLKDEPQFKFLVEEMGKSAKDYNVNELTCSLLYLSKMEIDFMSPTILSIVDALEVETSKDAASLSLPVLSRTCVALKSKAELRSQILLLKLMPTITSKIDEVSTAADLRLISICLLHTHHLLSKDTLLNYKKTCYRLLEQSLIEPTDERILLKVLTFLSVGFWANENVDLVRRVTKLLETRINRLEARHIVSLSKALQMHFEPAPLLEEVVLRARHLLGSDIERADKTLTAGIMSAAVNYSTHAEKRQIEKLLHQELRLEYFLPNMMSLFQVLRSLKTSDQKLCYTFWSKTLDVMGRHESERTPAKLHRVAHRYMYFNNNMGGTFRHYGFEKQMIMWLLAEIQTGSTSIVPSKVARSVSFILAYCRDPQILIETLDQLLPMLPQLSKIDCASLSRGVEIMMELMRRRQIPADVMSRLVALDTGMNESAWRHLDDDDLNISDLNALLRTHHNRRASSESLLFHTIVQRLSETKDPLSSRLIRDFSHCFSGLNYLLPSIMDQLADYVVANENSVMAETAEKLLHSCYQLGYTPVNANHLFETCSRLLIRDKDRLSCLSIIQMCLALSYFHSFPEELVSFVFAVDFLERIDDELAVCYSKATYPVRVRHSLMELNRSVCLDLPQLDVPWFHAKYCEELAALDPEILSIFHRDVGDHLLHLIEDNKCLQTGVYSPYGYKINFLVYLDGMTKPLQKQQSDLAKERVAILLHSDRQFTSGVVKLKGPQKMRQRHLEMLGYRVIPIAESVWNSMQLTESYAKKTFLAEKLWPER